MIIVTVLRANLRSYCPMPGYKQALTDAERRAIHGIITRAQAREAGLSNSVILDCLGTGRWVRVHPRVFRVASHPETYKSRALAALKWAGEDRAFISHDTTLALEGIDGFPPRKIHITAPTGRNTTGVVVHRLRRPARTRVRDGIRVCRLERALLDICARSDPVRCGEAIDDALRQQKTTLDLLWEEHDKAGKGVRGCKVFGTLLEGRDFRDGKLESKLEARLLAILRRIKGYDFQVQYPFRIRGKNYRLDFYNVETRTGVEGKGARWHLGKTQLDRDSDRHNDLTLGGLALLYYTWDDVSFRDREVEAEVTEMVEARRATLLVHHM